MSPDDLHRLFARSALVGAAVRARAYVRAAARSSALASMAARAGRSIGALTPTSRARLGGILVLTAIATGQLLQPLIPVQMRPAPAIPLRALVAVAAALVVVAAPHFARAWPKSRVRAALARLSPHAG